MQRIDFFRLERPIQERFIASAQGASQPVPLALKREPLPRNVLVWGAACGGLTIALIALASLGFGDLESSFALQPAWLVALYAGLGGAAAFCGRQVVAILRARRALPYAPGVYVFPSGVIDTRGPEFVVRPLKELTNSAARDRALVLEFEDRTRFSFKMPNRQHAEEVVRLLGEYRNRIGNDAAPPSQRELALLDPLCDNGFKNPFSPRESMRPPAPKKFQLGMLAALFGGALVGAGVFAFRNWLAEDALYRAARLADDRAAYVAYTERGGARPEVREILLPRTELKLVRAQGSLEALEAFVAAHKTSKIAQEADIALQHALRAGLESARREGTLTALKAFQQKHGSHPSIAAHVERAIEEHWKARLTEFEQKAKPKPEAMDFFRRLLAYTSKHGSRVEIRFRRRLPESVDRAEMMIKKALTFGGEASLPKQYFDDKHSTAREEPVAKEILATLSQAFPTDLVEFHLAPPLEDSPEDVPEVKVPTLLITHRTEMSGGYLLKNPRAALTGIGVLFRVTFQIPGDPEVHFFKLSTWNAPELKKASEFTGFGAIYDEMAVRAFSKLPKKYLAELVPGLVE